MAIPESPLAKQLEGIVEPAMARSGKRRRRKSSKPAPTDFPGPVRMGANHESAVQAPPPGSGARKQHDDRPAFPGSGRIRLAATLLVLCVVAVGIHIASGPINASPLRLSSTFPPTATLLKYILLFAGLGACLYRMNNIGMRWRYLLLMPAPSLTLILVHSAPETTEYQFLAPILSTSLVVLSLFPLWLGWRILCTPKGYHTTRRLDLPGKLLTTCYLAFLAFTLPIAVTHLIPDHLLLPLPRFLAR